MKAFNKNNKIHTKSTTPHPRKKKSNKERYYLIDKEDKPNANISRNLVPINQCLKLIFEVFTKTPKKPQKKSFKKTTKHSKNQIEDTQNKVKHKSINPTKQKKQHIHQKGKNQHKHAELSPSQSKIKVSTESMSSSAFWRGWAEALTGKVAAILGLGAVAARHPKFRGVGEKVLGERDEKLK